MITLHASDIRATLWPQRLVRIRRSLNRSSIIIMALGMIVLLANAGWLWWSRDVYVRSAETDWIAWLHPVYFTSLIIAMVLLCAMRQIRHTRQKLAALGYPLLDRISKRRGLEIWKTVDPLTKRPVILHVIHAEKYPRDLADWKVISHQWVKRGEKARRLNSPHAARVLDCGFAGHNNFYSVMEMPKGITLRELIDSHGPCPAERAVYLLAQIAHALEDAHQHELTNLQIDSTQIYVGSKATNVDWITTIFYGYESTDASEELRCDETIQFIHLAVGLFTGRWPDPEMTASEIKAMLDESKTTIPYVIKDTLVRYSHKDDSHIAPSIREIVRRMATSLNGPDWNEDRATAWWKHHEASATYANQKT